MTPTVSDFNSRTTTSFGLSISTGLMFETLFEATAPRIDNKRVPPDRIDLTGFSKHYINVYTLVRNIVSSIKGFTLVECVNSEALYKILKQEMLIITSLYVTNYSIVPVFYIPDYKKIMVHLNIGKPNTNPPASTRDIVTYRELRKKIGKFTDDSYKVITIDYKLDKEDASVLITTHVIADLCNFMFFKDMVLLESHTGKIKRRTEWYTKLTSGVDNMNTVPFNELTYYLFGDNTVSRPLDIRSRRLIVDILTQKKITSISAPDKTKLALYMDKTIGGIVRAYNKIYK